MAYYSTQENQQKFKNMTIPSNDEGVETRRQKLLGGWELERVPPL